MGISIQPGKTLSMRLVAIGVVVAAQVVAYESSKIGDGCKYERLTGV